MVAKKAENIVLKCSKNTANLHPLDQTFCMRAVLCLADPLVLIISGGLQWLDSSHQLDIDSISLKYVCILFIFLHAIALNFVPNFPNSIHHIPNLKIVTSLKLGEL